MYGNVHGRRELHGVITAQAMEPLPTRSLPLSRRQRTKIPVYERRSRGTALLASGAVSPET